MDISVLINHDPTAFLGNVELAKDLLHFIKAFCITIAHERPGIVVVDMRDAQS